MKITPLNDRVLIRVSEAEEKSKGGIYIPQSAQEKTQIGTVDAVGSADSICVKVKQKVMYDKYAGTSFKDGDVNYLIVKAEDIIAIVG